MEAGEESERGEGPDEAADESEGRWSATHAPPLPMPKATPPMRDLGAPGKPGGVAFGEEDSPPEANSRESRRDDRHAQKDRCEAAAPCIPERVVGPAREE